MTIPLEYIEDDAIRRNFQMLAGLLGVVTEVPTFVIDSGSPNSVITASPPARCFVRAGGASSTEWQKISGVSTDTGWQKVQTAP